MSVASIELAERGVLTLLKEELSEALTAVATEWASVEAVELGSVQSWLRGDRATVIDLEQSGFPVILVNALEQNPNEINQSEGYGEGLISINVEWYVSGDTEAECHTRVLRYGQALCMVLLANERVATGVRYADHWPPRVIFSEIMEALPPDVGSGISGDTFYTKAGRVTFDLAIQYGGTDVSY